MSEVKRYWIHWNDQLYAEDKNGDLVMAEDFDRVTAERDALQARETGTRSLLRMAEDSIKHILEREKALQALLTAADERADVLETALAGMLFAFDDGVGREWSEDLLDFARKLTAAKEFNAALKPAEGADYRKSCEVAHKALSMENQRIVAPGQFKCLACGDVHPGSGNLPCPKMSPTA